MKIQALRTFLSVAVLASFSKAAEEQKVTQSAVSQSLKAVEAEVGKPLVFRAQGRGQTVTLTKAGKEFKARAKNILDHYDKAIAAIAKIEREEPGSKKTKAEPKVKAAKPVAKSKAAKPAPAKKPAAVAAA